VTIAGRVGQRQQARLAHLADEALEVVLEDGLLDLELLEQAGDDGVHVVQFPGMLPEPRAHLVETEVLAACEIQQHCLALDVLEQDLARQLHPLAPERIHDRLPAQSSRSSAWARSSTRSRAYSMPTETLSSDGPMPSSRRSGSGTEAWVIFSGWLISDSTPPRFSARTKMRRLRQNAVAVSRSPSISQPTIPEKPLICRAAMSWPGWSGRPG